MPRFCENARVDKRRRSETYGTRVGACAESEGNRRSRRLQIRTGVPRLLRKPGTYGCMPRFCGGARRIQTGRGSAYDKRIHKGERSSEWNVDGRNKAGGG